MIMSVEEFKTFVQSDLTDNVLEAKLQALELLIRRYTNNNFQKNEHIEEPLILLAVFSLPMT